MLGLIAGGLGLASFVGDALNRSAARKQAEAQAAAQAENIELMNQRYAEMQQMLQPYTTAGAQALQQQQALTGALGPEAQQRAVSGIADSPELQALIGQGEEALLQRASATGGLRGGNIQGALAQYRPQMVNQAIQQRYQQLGGLASMGSAAASGLGAAGLGAGQTVGQMNLSQAGLGATSPWGDLGGSLLTGLGSGLGAYTGLGGTFGMGGAPPASPYVQPFNKLTGFTAGGGL